MRACPRWRGVAASADAMTLEPKKRRSSASASRFFGSTLSRFRNFSAERDSLVSGAEGAGAASSPYFSLSSASARSTSSSPSSSSAFAGVEAADSPPFFFFLFFFFLFWRLAGAVLAA